MGKVDVETRIGEFLETLFRELVGGDAVPCKYREGLPGSCAGLLAA
jgi:hypothetical protein